MKCPYCGFPESKVLDSRPAEDGQSVRRRRECNSCMRRYTTYEVVETIPVLVIKKDSSREPFDRAKIMTGLVRATQKRPVSREMMEDIADDIERTIAGTYQKEVTSVEIGNMVMEILRKIDEISYIRFASVYKQFSDINSFIEEIKNLSSSKD